MKNFATLALTLAVLGGFFGVGGDQRPRGFGNRAESFLNPAERLRGVRQPAQAVLALGYVQPIATLPNEAGDFLAADLPQPFLQPLRNAAVFVRAMLR